MRILYLAATGPDHATKASIPFHIAVNGSVEAGQECAVALAGDAVELAKRGVAETVEGVGIPPARDLLNKLRDHEVPIYVWKGCAVAREVTEADLEWIGASWTTPPELARMVADYDRVVSV